MSSIKGLIGQTAIYGISSIVGRLLNFLLVPLYARVFLPEEAAVYVDIYAFVAFFIVILTYGMETSFFRFTENETDKEKVYSTSFLSILTTTIAFIAVVLVFTKQVSVSLRYPEHPEYIVYFVFIVSLDAITAIPFAKLRSEEKAVRFATIKIINITINILSNLILILYLPYLYKTGGSDMQQLLSFLKDGKPQVGFIFLSNLIASVVTLFMLYPEIQKIKFRFDKVLLRRMLVYGFPLLIFGLAGIVNETIDRIMIKYILPESKAMVELGIYGICYKISLFISIFIQAFRYAAEPFFFAQYKHENAKETYAVVMNYFIIVCLFIFLAIMLFMDTVKYFVSEAYFSGLHIVPILLCANISLGIFYNLSVWYKLTGQTKFGAYISLFGAAITIILNLLLIPRIGYTGAAWTTFICYFMMMLISYFYGKKYYPIPYKINKFLLYTALTAGIYIFTLLVNIPNVYLKNVIHALLLIGFLTITFIYEPELKTLFIRKHK